MSISTDILMGKYDSDLDSIYEAYKQRRKLTRQAMAAVTMSGIKVGDNVMIKDISPKYLQGHIVEVTAKKNTRLTVKVLKSVRKFYEGQQIIIPASCVVKQG